MLTTGSFLLTIELLGLQLNRGAFLLTTGAISPDTARASFACNWGFVAHNRSFVTCSGNLRLNTSTDCKQKKTPTGSGATSPHVFTVSRDAVRYISATASNKDSRWTYASTVAPGVQTRGTQIQAILVDRFHLSSTLKPQYPGKIGASETTNCQTMKFANFSKFDCQGIAKENLRNTALWRLFPPLLPTP